MFWGEAVVDRDGCDVGSCGKGGDELVEFGAGGGAEAEAAAVDVDKEGEFFWGCGGDLEECSWEVETGREAGLGVDEDVFGSDGELRVVGRRGKLGLTGALDGAVFVDTEEGGEVVGYFGGG